MSKLYQIKEEDLALLESEMPRILDANPEACNDPLTRKRWEQVKRIISDVRWEYGPSIETHRLDA